MPRSTAQQKDVSSLWPGIRSHGTSRTAHLFDGGARRGKNEMGWCVSFMLVWLYWGCSLEFLRGGNRLQWSAARWQERTPRVNRGLRWHNVHSARLVDLLDRWCGIAIFVAHNNHPLITRMSRLSGLRICKGRGDILMVCRAVGLHCS